MRSALATVANRRAGRQRSTSLSAVPPSRTSTDYLPELAGVASSIIYKSPLPSQSGLPIYIVNAAAFPDAFEVDYDSLLPYVLARLPGEDELLSGTEYEIVFFAGGTPEGATAEKKNGPGIGWYLQAYHVLSRATRKKLQRLYIVHPRTWVRVLVSVFGTVVSPKFRRKIIHVNTITGLALQLPVEQLLVPPTVYLHDRRLSPDIDVPYASGRRAFGARHPLPRSLGTGKTRLPRVLRETTSFVLLPPNVRTEGLFRIPPHSVLTSVLKEAYDRGQKYIVWKERDATYVQPGLEQDLLDEVRLEDAYGIHSAASLIKTWYRDLREPIFPESSYAPLRAEYNSPDTPISLADLIALLHPTSETSPLSSTSREIITRHLLPLLSTVASHEPDNKMSPENLAICFAMTLVCGSNQLDDAKMTSVIRRLLQAAVEIWPQLRSQLGLTEAAFHQDLAPPKDPSDYEDPLDEIHRNVARHSEDDAMEPQPPMRIQMPDLDSPTSPTQPPTLPPRPRAPSQTTNATSNFSSAKPPAPPIPRRKPAPPSPALEHSPNQPPRYSTIFDADPPITDSPAAAAAAQSLNPLHQSSNSSQPPSPPAGAFASLHDSSAAENVKKGFPTFQPPRDHHPIVGMPKRRPLGAGESMERAGSSEPTSAVSEPPQHIHSQKDDTAVQRSVSASAGARAAAQHAALSLAQRPDPVSAPGNLEREGEATFRKPSWPASRPPPQVQIQGQGEGEGGVPMLSKPMPRARGGGRETRPISMMPTSAVNGSGSGELKPTGFAGARIRAPSPGLLRRMSSIEGTSSSSTFSGSGANYSYGNGNGSAGSDGNLGVNGGLEKMGKLNLKKASVDDLRRLYEDRGKVVEGLGKVEAVRRAGS